MEFRTSNHSHSNTISCVVLLWLWSCLFCSLPARPTRLHQKKFGSGFAGSCGAAELRCDPVRQQPDGAKQSFHVSGSCQICLFPAAAARFLAGQRHLEMQWTNAIIDSCNYITTRTPARHQASKQTIRQFVVPLMADQLDITTWHMCENWEDTNVWTFSNKARTDQLRQFVMWFTSPVQSNPMDGWMDEKTDKSGSTSTDKSGQNQKAWLAVGINSKSGRMCQSPNFKAGSGRCWRSRARRSTVSTSVQSGPGQDGRTDKFLNHDLNDCRHLQYV